MTAPVIPTLGASTVNRKWVYEFNTGSTGSPVWTTVGGVMDSQFQPDTPNWVANTTQAGKGYSSQNKSGSAWSGTLTVDRRVGQMDPTTYDVGQEYLRTKAIGKFGPQNTVELRVSEYDPNDPTGVATPRVEAYHGFCGVSWVPSGGDMMADDQVVITLNSQGALDMITHPYPKTAPTVPVLVSITPTALAAAGGDIVIIQGSGFTGTTGVTFLGTAATKFRIQSDSELLAVAPAHAAGSGQIVVTNAVGVSAAGPVVTFA